MVTFNFIGGYPSIQEENQIKEKFLQGLAEFREEFEAKEAFVTINLKANRDSSDFAHFTFGKEPDSLIDFISRFQQAYPAKDK